jgi:tRNA threonylcarbamoyladenosine biosynthesis protein TsaE
VTSPSETDRLQTITHSPAETQHLGTRLARGLMPGDIVCLQGDLGSGKTCLTQGIARGLGVAGAVASPTFIIINEYRIPGPARRLRHVDLYRVESVGQAGALGLEDYLHSDGICVIEWAERMTELLPKERLWVTLRYLNETDREVVLEAVGQHYEDLLAAISHEAYEA